MEGTQSFMGSESTANEVSKWEMLQARATPEEKEEIYLYCKSVLKMPYSVVTRLFWRRIIASYRSMPQLKNNDIMKEIQQASDDLMMYVPVIARQREKFPRLF